MAWGGRRTGKRRGNVYRCVIKKQAIVVNRQRDLQTVTSLRVVSPVFRGRPPERQIFAMEKN